MRQRIIIMVVVLLVSCLVIRSQEGGFGNIKKKQDFIKEVKTIHKMTKGVFKTREAREEFLVKNLGEPSSYLVMVFSAWRLLALAKDGNLNKSTLQVLEKETVITKGHAGLSKVGAICFLALVVNKTKGKPETDNEFKDKLQNDYYLQSVYCIYTEGTTELGKSILDKTAHLARRQKFPLREYWKLKKKKWKSDEEQITYLIKEATTEGSTAAIARLIELGRPALKAILDDYTTEPKRFSKDKALYTLTAMILANGDKTSISIIKDLKNKKTEIGKCLEIIYAVEIKDAGLFETTLEMLEQELSFPFKEIHLFRLTQ